MKWRKTTTAMGAMLTAVAVMTILARCQVHAAVIFQVDRETEGADGFLDTQEDFLSWTGDGGSITDGVVTVSSDGGDMRDRDVIGGDNPSSQLPPDHPLADLLRDFSHDQTDLSISISGLEPNTTYKVTLWGYDPHFNSGRGTTWYLGTDNTGPVIVEYIHDASNPDGAVNFREDFTADGAGILDFYGEGDTFGGQASGTIVVFNGLRIEDSTPAVPLLQAGDADMDWDFDQLDLVQVQIAAKYLSGQAATWGEGDWDGAPGGEAGNPPAGNGFFDQIDIISALAHGLYLKGPYAAIGRGGMAADGQTSIVYNPGTGEVALDAPEGTELTSINIDSAGGIFTGDAAQNLGGSFDNDTDNNIFKATFGSSFGSLSFGNVAQAGLSEAFLLNDLTVVGSLAGGGDLGAVDLIYVPEPAGAALASVALVILVFLGRCSPHRRRSRAC